MAPESEKALVAESALTRVRSGMTIGLGTGSTADLFLRALGEALRSGALRNVVGVPTSRRTQEQAERMGIPLTTLVETPELDMALDGADEVDPKLDLIKGLGGALLREKMVAQAAKRFIVMVDSSKQVSRLGTKAPLPVEVIPFMWRAHEPWVRGLGGEPRIRMDSDGQPFVTDNGNLILDCEFADGIADPLELQAACAVRAGVVESGLFVGMTTEVHLAHEGRVVVLEAGQ